MYKATGGAWGGNKINGMFENFLKEILGEKVLSKVKKYNMSDWYRMVRDFEQTKRTLGAHMDENIVVVRLENCVNEIY